VQYLAREKTISKRHGSERMLLNDD